MEGRGDNGSDDRLDGPVLDSANGQDYYKTNGTPRSWPESCVSRGPSTASCLPSAWGLAGSWGGDPPRGPRSRPRWSWPQPLRPPSRRGGAPPITASTPSPATTTTPARAQAPGLFPSAGH